MKILIATKSFFPERDGVANVCLCHAEGFLKFGHEVFVSTKKNKTRDFDILNSMNISVHEFDIYCKANYSYKGEVDKYQKFLVNSDFDVIFFHCLHSWNTDIAFQEFKKIDSIKVLVSHGYSGNIIYSIRGVLSYLSWNRLKYRIKLKNLLSSFDHIVFLSQKTDKNRFLDKLIVQRNFVDPPFNNHLHIHFRLNLCTMIEIYTSDKHCYYIGDN